MQHRPLSARGELRSHPLAGQAQACGRLTKGGWAGGARWHLSWPLADTTAQKKKLDYISRFVHVILAPVHAILLCIVQARNSSNFVRHPYAGAVLSDLHTQTLSEKRVETGKSSGPCTVVIPVQSTVPEFHTSLPCRRTSPLDTSCNSLLENCTQKKTTCHLRGHAARKKGKHDMCSHCTCPSIQI